MHPWPAPKACYNGERPDPRTPVWPYRSNREDLVKTVLPMHTYMHIHTHTTEFVAYVHICNTQIHRYTHLTAMQPHNCMLSA